MDGAHPATRCADGACSRCNSALLALLQAYATPVNVDLLDLPCAAGLIEQARALSIATGEPPLASLRRIVDDFSGAAAIAQQHLAAEEIG